MLMAIIGLAHAIIICPLNLSRAFNTVEMTFNDERFKVELKKYVIFIKAISSHYLAYPVKKFL